MAAKKAVLVRCMDYRHGSMDKTLVDAIGEAYGNEYVFYELTWPGGAGVFTEIDQEVRPLFVRNIKLALDELHAEAVFIAVHGTSEYDGNGCGGYIINGFEKAYKTPKESAAFSVEELKKSANFLEEQGITVTALYVTFDESGNQIEEVTL